MHAVVREVKLVILLALGFALCSVSTELAQLTGMPELAPVLFNAGLVAFAVGFARLIIRIWMPWLDLSVLVRKAKGSEVGAAIVTLGAFFLIIEVLKIVVVR